MFWFCKPKPIDVYLYTAREEVFNHAKPQKAVYFFPEWIKRLPPSKFSEDPNAKLIVNKTIKSCSGVADLYKLGIIFPLWSDLNVEINPDRSFRFQFIDEKSKAAHHPKSQMEGAPFANTHVNLKLSNPWFIQTNQDVKFLVTSPVWNGIGYQELIIPPAVISAYSFATQMNINIMFEAKQNKTVYELFLGQPLLHVIPISERRINLHHVLVTEQELQKMNLKNPMFLMGRNRYRRAEKSCPHA